MSRHFKRFTVGVAALAALLAGPRRVSTLSAQQIEFQQAIGSQQGAEQGVLLLVNGRVLQGRIARAGDRYHVAVDAGAITVRASDVDLCCRSLRDAYQRKRARVCPGSAADHAELARWCQQVGLLDEALRELADAKAFDPTHLIIPLIERRVEMSLHPLQPVERRAEPVDDPVSSDDLDGMVRGMPSGTVESFTQTIQPLLMNHCSTGGCHGPDSRSRLRLLRLPQGGPPSRRLTQRNLHAALQAIDWGDPPASPLLTAPIRPHGSAKAPIFTDHQFAQYRQVVDWVNRVAQTPQPQQDVATVSHHGRDDRVGEGLPAVYTSPATSSATLAPFPGQQDGVPANVPAGHPAIDTQINSLWGRPGASFQQDAFDWNASPADFTPSDAFDPQIFNRRFFSGSGRGELKQTRRAAR